jgi:hypothetical protein
MGTSRLCNEIKNSSILDDFVFMQQGFASQTRERKRITKTHNFKLTGTSLKRKKEQSHETFYMLSFHFQGRLSRLASLFSYHYCTRGRRSLLYYTMYVFWILLVRPEVMETLRMGMAIAYRLFWLSLHVVVDLGSYRSLNHLHFCACCCTILQMLVVILGITTSALLGQMFGRLAVDPSAGHSFALGSNRKHSLFRITRNINQTKKQSVCTCRRCLCNRRHSLISNTAVINMHYLSRDG